ncbi:gastrokine-1-like [Melanerpes formicivorus]|uniref:gastrokine-1-like n=1 Tax=Melanerpes formicivorus TaxID=211600 RepID=UPI00358E2C92
MNFPIVAAALLGAVLAPAFADGNGEKNLKGHQGENSHHPATGGFNDLKEYSQAFRTLWDTETGYVATKVLSKNTCIISNMGGDSWLDEPFPASAQGLKGPQPHYLPPRENRFIISTERLQTLQPYGKRIQELCRGISSYFAYPAPGSNFLDKEVTCLKVKIKELPVHYCF